MIRCFDLAGNCPGRTVLGTFSTADTELRIDVELTERGADLGTALLVPDMLLVFLAEALHGAVRSVP